MRIFLASIFLLFALTASAATTHYVRDGGGAGAGTSWGDTMDNLPSPLTRGDTYYIADGSYGDYSFDDAVSGTTLITVKKATVADHGTSTGWSDAYGDGVATWGTIQWLTDYYLFDGMTRDENDWWSQTAYGFRVTGGSIWNTSWNGVAGGHITNRFCDIGGTHSTSFSEGHPDAAIYFGGFTELCQEIAIEKCYLHNVDIPIQIAGGDGILVEYCAIGPSWQKETIRGQNTAKNITIRYNLMLNGCQAVSGDPPDGRVDCTADIAIWDGGANQFDNIFIHGNVIASTVGTWHSDAVIMLGGDGGATAAGSPANNCYIYNNTFAGLGSGQLTIRLNGADTETYARNNLWYDCGSNTGSTAGVNSSNIVAGSDPFVTYAGRANLRLSAGIAGYTLSSPYASDLTGATRGSDSTFDVGAYEFDSGAPGDTNAPTVTAFTIPATASSLTVSISTFTATDAVGVTGYLVNESASEPSLGDGGWSGTAQTSYTFASAGSKTLYAWAKDAAGNISASLNDSVTITLDTTAPTVTAFTIPATATSLTVSISTFTATDDAAVTGYLVNESASTPSLGDGGWSVTAQTSYTFASAGSKTLYAWAKDAAGNISTSASDGVTITLPGGVWSVTTLHVGPP